MNAIKQTVLLATGLLLALAQGGCMVGRAVATTNQFDVPNTITSRGFKYVKKGVVGRYDLRGIFPAKLNREQVAAGLNVADEAYRRLLEAAGGLNDNQAFVNVVVEASFVHKKTFSSNDLSLTVAFYADKIEFAAAAAPASARARRNALVGMIRTRITEAAQPEPPTLDL